MEIYPISPIAGLAVTDSNFIVGDGSGWVVETGNTARTSLGLGTGDSPAFTASIIGGTLTLASGSITDSGGEVSFGDDDITQFILGSEIVSNGDFTTDSDWTFGGDWSHSAPGEYAMMDAFTLPNSGNLTQVISASIVLGRTYRLVYTISVAGTPTFSVQPTVSGETLTNRTTAATYTQDFTPTVSGLLTFAGSVTDGAGELYIDDVSIKEVITTLISVTSTNRIGMDLDVFGDVSVIAGKKVNIFEEQNTEWLSLYSSVSRGYIEVLGSNPVALKLQPGAEIGYISCFEDSPSGRTRKFYITEFYFTAHSRGCSGK